MRIDVKHWILEFERWWYRQPYAFRGAASAAGAPLFLIALTLGVYHLRSAPRPFEHYVGASLRISPNGESEERNVDRTCTPFWENLASLDLNRFNREVYSFDYAYAKDRALKNLGHLLARSVELRADRSCEELPDWHYLRQRDEEFEKDCGPVVGTIQKRRKLHDGDLYECFNSLLRYRFHIVAYFTRNVRLDRITDLRVLTNKLFALGLLNDASRAGELSAILDRMRQIDPYNWDIVYGLAQTRYIDLVINQKNDEGRKLAEAKLENALAAAEAINPAHVGLMELRIYLSRYRGDLTNMRKLATQIEQENPGEGTGPYYLGWVSFLEAKTDETNRNLREAFARDPYSFRVRYSLNKFLNLGMDVPDIAVFNEQLGNFGVHYNFSARDPVAYGIGFRLWPWPLFRGPMPDIETLRQVQAHEIDVKTMKKDTLKKLLSPARTVASPSVPVPVPTANPQ